MNPGIMQGGPLQEAFQEFRQRRAEWGSLDADSAILTFVSFCESGASEAYREAMGMHQGACARPWGQEPPERRNCAARASAGSHGAGPTPDMRTRI